MLDNTVHMFFHEGHFCDLLSRTLRTSVKRWGSFRIATLNSSLTSVSYSTLRIHFKHAPFSKIQPLFGLCFNTYPFVRNLNEWLLSWTILTIKKRKCHDKSLVWPEQKGVFHGLRITRIKMDSYRSVINSKNERKRDTIFVSHLPSSKNSILWNDSWIQWTFQKSHVMQKGINVSRFRESKRNESLIRELNEKTHVLILLSGRRNATQVDQHFQKLQKWHTALIMTES